MNRDPKAHTLRVEERENPLLGRVFLAVCSCGWTGTVSRIRVRAIRPWHAHVNRATDGRAA